MVPSLATTRRPLVRRLLGLVAGAVALGGTGLANDFVTSFEFPNSGDTFVLGQSPTRAFFDGAPTAIVGNIDLYVTGFYGWVANPGVTQTITLETPAGAFEMFARRDSVQAEGLVELFDANGNMVFSVEPEVTSFTKIVRPQGAPPIAFVRIQNTGTTGLVSVDDVSYCAAPWGPGLGSNFCGPAVPNSSGQAGAMRATGSSFATAQNVTLRAEQLPTNVFGFFLTSTTQGFVAGPGGSQGNLCLSGAVGRFTGPGQLLNSGAMGAFELKIDLNQIPTPTGATSALAGDTWNFQAWTRDTVGGTSTSNLTDGLELQFN